MEVYRPNFPSNYQGNVLAESNLPAATDDLSLADNILYRWFSKPRDYLYRTPLLEDLGSENRKINPAMTLNSFAAFAGPAASLAAFGAFGQELTQSQADAEAAATGTPDYSIGQILYGDAAPEQYTSDWTTTPAATPAAPVTRQNPILDAISGVVRTTAQAGGQAITQRLTGQPAQRAAAAKPAQSNMTPLLIGGAAILILLVAMK